MGMAFHKGPGETFSEKFDYVDGTLGALGRLGGLGGAQTPMLTGVLRGYWSGTLGTIDAISLEGIARPRIPNDVFTRTSLDAMKNPDGSMMTRQTQALRAGSMDAQGNFTRIEDMTRSNGANMSPGNNRMPAGSGGTTFRTNSTPSSPGSIQRQVDAQPQYIQTRPGTWERNPTWTQEKIKKIEVP